ncbi:hypothetical protein [Syntrophomonas palmitatica]|nr:hypothetical protein [Syntrophomonas palmitatica]
MKCPKCGQDLHIRILDNRDADMLAVQIICPKHGELFLATSINGVVSIL